MVCIQMLLELLQVPHVSWYLVEILVVSHFYLFLSYRIIGQMAEQVVCLPWVVVLSTESDVAVFVIVYFQWVPACDHNPNTYVKFPV